VKQKYKNREECSLQLSAATSICKIHNMLLQQHHSKSSRAARQHGQEHIAVNGDVTVIAQHQHGGSGWYHDVSPIENLDIFWMLCKGCSSATARQQRLFSIGSSAG
jgi:hypothetical protein